MREITEVVLGFPTVTFTAALVLVVGLWTLLLLNPPTRGRAARRAGADSPDVHGTRVIAAASLVIAVAWILSLAGSLLLRPHEAAPPLGTALAALVLVASLALATPATRLVTRMWHRLHG